MFPPTSAPPADIDFFCTAEELLLSLEKIHSGSPLPQNVYDYVNPYQYLPTNLPEDIWFFIHSKEKAGLHGGSWKAKGEPCTLFSNSLFIGGRTTLEFYEGQIPYECKTDWVMQEFWINYRESCENSKAKETGLLCRVFLGGEQIQNNEKRRKMDMMSIAGENLNHGKPPVTSETNSNMTCGSSSKRQMKRDDETVELAVAGKPSDNHLENSPEIDDYLSGGDFLELLDLDNPASSPSSSSDNSSCLTISSDECFDALALLQDLERENGRDLVQKDAACKCSVSEPLRLNEVVIPTTSCALDSALPGKVPRKKYGGGPSSDPHEMGASSSSSLPTATDGEKKATVGRLKKLKKKYLCFFPF